MSDTRAFSNPPTKRPDKGNLMEPTSELFCSTRSTTWERMLIADWIMWSEWNDDVLGPRSSFHSFRQSIDGINAKVSRLQVEREQFAHSAGSRKHPPLSRACARRMAALNARSEDFSEELRAVSSDDERQPTGSPATSRKDSEVNPKDLNMTALLVRYISALLKLFSY